MARYREDQIIPTPPDSGSGGYWDSIPGYTDWGPNTITDSFLPYNRAEGGYPSMEEGGPIPETGLYRLHEGEVVVPSNVAGGMAPDMGGGPSMRMPGGGGAGCEGMSGMRGSMEKVGRRRGLMR